MSSDFNLIDHPWLAVQRSDGTADEVSLRDVFRESASLRTLGGEVSTQAFANLRLCIALLYCSVGVPDRDAWTRLWRDGPPLGAVEEYLDACRDRFGLFDPVTPFYQVADLRTASGKVDGLEKLIADVPNGAPYQTTRAGAGLARISPAEAARWLVHVHAFDPSGIRSAAVGDPLQKAGKGYPIGPGWAGRLGGVVLLGDNLWQTLLLNTVPIDQYEARPDDDLAPWERDPDTALRTDFSDTGPRGPIHLLTLQSRRVRLIGDDGGVTGVILAQGDRLLPQNQFRFEPMTAWRYSKPQSQKLKTLVYMPRAHSPERALWRNTAALLPTIPGGDPPPTMPPRTMEWIGEVADVVGTRSRLGLQAIGMAYGSNESTVAEIINDTVDLSITLIGQESERVAGIIDDAVVAAETAVKLAGHLAANLARASGERGEDAGGAAYAKAVEDGFARVDQPCRRWLSELTGASERDAVLGAWHTSVCDIARDLARELLEQTGPAAVAGRMVDGTYISAALAEIWFAAGLAKALLRAAQYLEHRSKEGSDCS